MTIDQKKLQKNLKGAEKKALREVKKIKTELNALGKKTKRFIRENPEESLAIAAGVGSLIGAGVRSMFGNKETKKAKPKKAIKMKAKK